MARWTSVDPLADNYASWSTYNYVLGNPLKFIDPDGMRVDNTIYVDQDGNELHRTEDDLPDAVVVVDDADGFEACKSTCSNSESERRSQGMVYLVDGLSLLWESGEANPYGTDGSLVNGYKREGGWVSEESAMIEMNTDSDMEVNMQRSVNWEDPEGNMAGGQIGENNGLAHTHPVNKGLRKSIGPNMTTEVENGHPDGGPPSGKDYNQIGKSDLRGGQLRNVAVSRDNFHFYNGNRSQTFSVPRSFFNY